MGRFWAWVGLDVVGVCEFWEEKEEGGACCGWWMCCGFFEGGAFLMSGFLEGVSTLVVPQKCFFRPCIDPQDSFCLAQ